MIDKNTRSLSDNATIVDMVNKIEEINNILDSSISSLKQNLEDKGITCGNNDTAINLINKINEIETIDGSEALPKWKTSIGDVWIKCEPMPSRRAELSAAAVGTKIYCIGGNDSTGRLTINECYDIATNTWETKASIPTTVSQGRSGAIGTKIYCVGNYPYSSTSYCYDTVADIWSSMTTIPTGRAYMAAGVIDDKMYCVGGYSAYDTVTRVNECFDPATNTWTTMSSVPAARQEATGVVNNGIFYYIGGRSYTSADSTYYSTNYAYDPVANSWTTKASAPLTFANATGGGINGKVYCSGGFTTNPLYPRNYILTTLCYDPETNTWVTVNGEPEKRGYTGHCVVNNILYSIGGENGGDIIFDYNYAYVG